MLTNLKYQHAVNSGLIIKNIGILKGVWDLKVTPKQQERKLKDSTT